MSYPLRRSPGSWTMASVPFRATLGSAIILLAMHVPLAGTSAGPQPPAVRVEQARLRLDPNVATRDELMLLPRIGPAIAGYIIEFRQSQNSQPAFECAEDLQRVRRIGPRTLAELRPWLRFPPAYDTDTGKASVQP